VPISPLAPLVVTARSCANIALVKYWGKRDAALNLPAAGSLSLTLASLITETTVAFDAELARDAMTLDGEPVSEAVLAKTSQWLDLVRGLVIDRGGRPLRARVDSVNHFPTASGLASSASGFAALAVAATRAAGLELSARELSILARRGSGSAARSIFGGFVRMHAGSAANGLDSFAEPVLAPALGEARMLIAVVGAGAVKEHSSRDAMEHTAETSPYYAAWLSQVPRDLHAAERALADGDLPVLGALAEANALAMHASAMAARPGIIYWQPATLGLLAKVRELRRAGLPAWATMDAGPHVKVLTDAAHAAQLTVELAAVPGCSRVLRSEAGPGAMVVPERSDRSERGEQEPASS
jgi:diphosphomevalonate decarboxylase